MTFSEFFRWLKSEYISGCVAYYGARADDPWQAACEAIVMDCNATRDFDEKEKIIARYRPVFAKLIDSYVKEFPNLKRSLAMEGFYDAGLEHPSIRDRRCIHCSGRKKINLRTRTKARLPYFICEQCEVDYKRGAL